jgi:hypothetical protein
MSLPALGEIGENGRTVKHPAMAHTVCYWHLADIPMRSGSGAAISNVLVLLELSFSFGKAALLRFALILAATSSLLYPADASRQRLTRSSAPHFPLMPTLSPPARGSSRQRIQVPSTAQYPTHSAPTPPAPMATRPRQSRITTRRWR